MKQKLDVHAPPRHAVPQPHRPAAREHLILFCTPGSLLGPVQTKQKKQTKPKQTKKTCALSWIITQSRNYITLNESIQSLMQHNQHTENT